MKIVAPLLGFCLLSIVGWCQGIVASSDGQVNAVISSSKEIPRENGASGNGWTYSNAYWASPLIYRSQRFPNDGTGSFPFNEYGELLIQGTSYGPNYNKGISFLTWDGSVAFPAIRMRISETGLVGIGTDTPSASLHIKASRAQQKIEATEDHSWLFLTSVDNTGAGSPSLLLQRGNGNTYGQLTVERGDGGGGHAPSFTGGLANDVILGSTVNVPLKFGVNLDVKATIDTDGNMGIGTTTPDAKLTVKGDIHAEAVTLDLTVPGPDYVFEEDYNLRSLEETEDYIKTHKHLPEVPSAKEMEEQGIDLAEMNMLLLKKVEELTLIVIDQNKRIRILENQ